MWRLDGDSMIIAVDFDGTLCHGNWDDVWHDGCSHYYVDGDVLKNKKIPVLVYDESEKKYSYL